MIITLSYFSIKTYGASTTKEPSFVQRKKHRLTDR